MNRSIVALLCYFLLLASSASAFNITKILSQFSDYSTFNDLLSRSGLATEINKRATITVLAVPNGAIGDLTSKSDDVLKSILSTYVVLDYYDIPKLKNLKDKTAKLTTMYQQSGKAAYDQGFLNMTAKDGSFVFGSASKGAQRDSRLEKSVMNQPYNISILGISQPFVTPGLDGTLAPVSAPPPMTNNTTSSPKSSPPASDDEAESPEEEAESPVSQETEAPAPSKDADSSASSPAADSPTADSPAADSPTADSPAADSPPADAQATPSAGSSAGKLKVSFGLFGVLASMVAAF